MCGRFTLRTNLNRVLQDMGVDDGPDWTPRYNLAPTQSVPVVRIQAEGLRSCDLLRWGLVPSWAKDPKAVPRGGLINARSETVATQPAFRSAFRKRRCLVLADGYYEWKPAGKLKQPYFIRRPDDEPFTFAGLWEHWQPAEGSAWETFTLITTAANDLTRPIHDRMPVIVAGSDRDLWLSADADPSQLKPLMRPFDSDALVADPVSTAVNNPRNDVAECVKPIDV